MILASNGILASSIQNAVSPLLDTYTGAAAAYSVRLLRTAYAGSAIRVRRSSDNTEQDIGFSGGNLDTSALTTFVGANDGFVTTWYDQSGNARNATQATAVNQPQIVSSGTLVTFNGKPYIKYLDNADSLRTSNFAAAGNNRSYFAVAKMITNSANNLMLLEHGRGPLDDYRNGIGKFFSTSNVIQAQIGTGTANTRTSELTLNTTDDYLFSAFVASGSYLQFFSNGSLVQNLSTASVPIIDSSSQVNVGRTTGGGAASWLQSEAIYWDATNQIANRSGIESNINTYYAIY
jgi:hypothetical protein